MSLNCSSRSKTSYRETFLTLAHLNNFRFLFLHNILGILLSQNAIQKWFISKLFSPLDYKLLHGYTYSGTMTDKKFCWKCWTNFGRRISTEKEHEFVGGGWRSWITDLLQYMCVCVCVCVCVCIFVCLCVCVCVYIYVCVYICVCIYIYIYILCIWNVYYKCEVKAPCIWTWIKPKQQEGATQTFCPPLCNTCPAYCQAYSLSS